MNLNVTTAEHRSRILEMRWVRALADRERGIVGPLAEWLQSGNRRYQDIPPGVRNEFFFRDMRTEEIHAGNTWKSFGYGVEEMRAGRWQDLVHPDDREAMREAFHDYVYRQNIRVDQSLFRVADSRGRYRWLLASSAVIARSKDGEVRGYIGRDVDIGNRLEKELSLRKRIDEIEDQSTRERTLMQAAGRIAGSIDYSGLLSAVEETVLQLFGLTNISIGIPGEVASGTRYAGPEKVKPKQVHIWRLGQTSEDQPLILQAEGEETGPESDYLIKVLGPIILGSWERVRYLDILRRHATTDPLTGAWNRRAFMQQAGDSLRQACREHRPCAVSIMDVDYFKRVNDEFGHPFGDRVLVDIAAGMNQALRSGDFMCRWGGEEFAFFLGGTERDDAWKIVERIRVAAGENGGQTGQRVSLSGGLYWLNPDHPEPLASALRKADSALLLAKVAGRNRTVEHGNSPVCADT